LTEDDVKYLNRDTFQVGGYSRAYSANWESIFGARKAELEAEKAAKEAAERPSQEPPAGKPE
jgi:hypothetical protein